MCSEPVTFGGGMTMEKARRPAWRRRRRGRRPALSQRAAIFGSTVRGVVGLFEHGDGPLKSEGLPV